MLKDTEFLEGSANVLVKILEMLLTKLLKDSVFRMSWRQTGQRVLFANQLRRDASLKTWWQ